MISTAQKIAHKNLAAARVMAGHDVKLSLNNPTSRITPQTPVVSRIGKATAK